MDYGKKIDDITNELKVNVDQLKGIPKLLEKASDVVEILNREKDNFTELKKSLDGSLKGITAATEELTSTSKKSIKSQDEFFKSIKEELNNEKVESLNAIDNLTKESNKAYNDFIINVKEELSKGKKDNLDAIDNISRDVNNKINLMEGNLKNQLIQSEVTQRKSIDDFSKDLKQEVDTLNKQFSLLKILAIVNIACTGVAIILNFVIK